MDGFLGTKATSLSDVSLILETIIVILILVGYFYGRKHRGWNHHYLMLVTFIVDIGFLIVYMARRVLEPTVLFPEHNIFYFAVYLPIVIVHSIISSVALVIGAILVVKGIKRGIKNKEKKKYSLPKDYRPKHKKLGVWGVWSYLLSGITGIMVYVMLYMI